MKINEIGIRLIKEFEKCRLKAYKPVPEERLWTIGWGHYGVPAGTIWTQKQADEQLMKDLVKYEKAVNDLGRNFNENEFSALVSFCYNAGAGNLKNLCRNRSNVQIADALLLYNKGSGKVLAGLTKRRKAERELFLKPINAASKPVENKEELPYKVKTKCDLTIRSGPGVTYSKIKVAKKGSIFTVWAILTNGETRWGKNGNEYFSLAYCEKI